MNGARWWCGRLRGWWLRYRSENAAALRQAERRRRFNEERM